MLVFELSMPSNNSWNGRWSGAEEYYAIIRSFGTSKKALEQEEKILNPGRYCYNFGDGWVAAIKVRRVDSREAGKLRKKSKGFCGYNWMVESIIKNGRIIASHST